jgi:hypothetical protein
MLHFRTEQVDGSARCHAVQASGARTLEAAKGRLAKDQ